MIDPPNPSTSHTHQIDTIRCVGVHDSLVLDDTHRKAERHIIHSWRYYRCLSVNPVGRFSTHTEVTCC